MTDRRSAFFTFMGDRRPIRLADGTVVYLEGIGSISFLSTHGLHILINVVFYVPRFSTTLFLSIKFAKKHLQA